jgi:heat shock protein HspQ
MAPKFESGQIIHHTRFDYRGVIVSVDQTFQGTEDWYERVARSRPPRDKPWYHVLVHGSDAETYVAERHLEMDATCAPIDHPMLPMFFDDLRDGRYIRDRLLN